MARGLPPEVRVDPASGELFVWWGDSPVYRLTCHGELTEQLREPPEWADVFVHDDEVANRAAELIRDVPMAKTVRRKLAAALDVAERDLEPLDP